MDTNYSNCINYGRTTHVVNSKLVDRYVYVIMQKHSYTNETQITFMCMNILSLSLSLTSQHITLYTYTYIHSMHTLHEQHITHDQTHMHTHTHTHTRMHKRTPLPSRIVV